MNDLSHNPKVTALRPQKPVYRYEIADRQTFLEFDERYLYECWNSRTSKGSRAYLLHNLSPKLVSWRHIGDNGISLLRWAGILMLAAIVVFFSDLQHSIPLLAPSLGIVGLYPLTKGLKELKKRSWTYIYDDDGNFITSILIPDRETTDHETRRRDFEHKLVLAIERAKQQEYYDWE